MTLSLVKKRAIVEKVSIRLQPWLYKGNRLNDSKLYKSQSTVAMAVREGAEERIILFALQFKMPSVVQREHLAMPYSAMDSVNYFCQEKVTGASQQKR